LEQIARASRFATAMNTDADQARFEKMAAHYECELADATEAPQRQPSAAPTAPEDAVQSNGTTSGTADLNALGTATKTEGDQEPTD
jgi:hypothetical protein